PVARDDDRAAGVAERRGALERPVLQIAVEKAARESVTGAEYVQHVDGERRDVSRRRATAEDRRTAGAALDDERGDAGREQRGDAVARGGHARRGRDFLLSAHRKRRRLQQR